MRDKSISYSIGALSLAVEGNSWEHLKTLINHISELERQRDALVAENKALKALADDRRTFIMNGVQLGYIQVPTVESDPALETIRIAVSPQEPLKETAAALRELMARGCDKYADATEQIGKEENDEDIIYAGKQARLFAQQLREGKV